MAPPRTPRRPRTSAVDSEADATQLAPVLEAEGWELLQSLDAAAADEDPLVLSSRLRSAGHPPERVAAVLTQAALRRRAEAKLGEVAGRMLFTRDGLEQATRLPVARLHAERLRAAGARHVADLGCGLGVDALALAEAGLHVTAIERDPTVAAAAEVNLGSYPGAAVVTADAVAWAGEHLGAAAAPTVPGAGAPSAREDAPPVEDPAPPVDAVWLDPARRRIAGSGSSRVFDPEAFSPPLSFVEEVAAAGRTVGVKLGPGIPHAALPEDAEAQWVSVDGDVTEVVLWFNAARRPGVRRAALVVDTRAAAVPVLTELTSPEPAGGSPQIADVGQEAMADLVGHVLLEPDGAVIRAGLVTDLAERIGPDTRLLDPHLAYLTAPDLPGARLAPEDTRLTPGGARTDADVPRAAALARAYRIVAVHDYHVKSLRRWARETGVGRLDVKKRGMAITPEEVRRLVLPSSPGRSGKGGGERTGSRARTGEGRHATLVLARVGERRFALEVDPLPAPEG